MSNSIVTKVLVFGLLIIGIGVLVSVNLAPKNEGNRELLNILGQIVAGSLGYLGHSTTHRDEKKQKEEEK